MATLTFNPSSVDTANSSVSVSNAGNAYDAESTTNAATFSPTATANSTTSVYFNFNITGIPENAAITSVSLKHRSSWPGGNGTNNTGTTYFISRQAFICSGTTKKSDGVTLSNTTSSQTTIDTVTSNESWTVEDLQNVKFLLQGIKANSTQGVTVNVYGATLTVTYEEVTLYEITSILSTENVNLIDPIGTEEVLEGSSYTLKIYTNDISEIAVEDNGDDVTNQLVFHQGESESQSISSVPLSNFETGFSASGANFYISSTSSTTNNLDDPINHSAENPETRPTSNQWTYVKDGGSNTATGWIIFNFDFSQIPINAVITSVTVKCYGAKENTNTTSQYKSMIGLYSGTTLKSVEQEFTSTTPYIMTISNPGTWTREELQNAKLRHTVAYYGGWMGGVTWTVAYSVSGEDYYEYTITNITSDHEIEVGDNSSSTYYSIDTTVHAPQTSASPLYKSVKQGNSFTLTINTNNINSIVLFDNKVDVTSSIVSSGNSYTYTLTNVQKNHKINLDEKMWYSIYVESLYDSASISFSSNKVYEGDSATITVNVSNISSVNIKDNDVDITSSFTRVSTGVYQYTLRNANDNHEFIVLEANTYSLTSLSNTVNASISPLGISTAAQGTTKKYEITSDINWDLIILKDNNVDVTNNIVHQNQTTTSGTFIPSSLDTTNSSYSGTATNPNNGLTNASSTTNAQFTINTGANANTDIYYNIDCSAIPENAIINSVTCSAKISLSSTSGISTRTAQLYSGNNAKGSASTVPNSATAFSITCDTWTREELNDARIRVNIVRGTSSTTTARTVNFYGVTLTVNYTTPEGYFYTLSNINTNHTLSLYEVFVPQEEDPETVYHSVTISSINATTNPHQGTTRVEDEDDLVINIIPTDNLLTLATDNGVDISNQLVTTVIPDPVASRPTGTYQFNLDNSDGYYKPNNTGNTSTAALTRMTFNLPVRCLVTIQYINNGYRYNNSNTNNRNCYGHISALDTALNTTYNNTDGQYVFNTANDISSEEKTVTYEIPVGTHYIDFKYTRGSQGGTTYSTYYFWFKILNIQPLELLPTIYTLTNITEDHSLIFIYGNVVYYNIVATGENCNLFPNGNVVVLPNNRYSLNIIAEKKYRDVIIYDNNRNVGRYLEEIDNDELLNYFYSINRVNEDHEIIINCNISQFIYIKISGSFVEAQKVYKKVNGQWIEQDDYENIFEQNKIYISGS